MTLRSAPPLPTSSAGSPGRRRWLGMVVISLAVSLIIVDATIVNVMLPRIVAELRLTTTGAEWVTSIYSLVFAALLIPFGRAADAYGRRRMIVLGTVVFVVASVLAALSGSGSALVGARALQGIGASMTLPGALSTVTAVFTGRDRAIAFGIWGSLIGGMAALGPLLGGWLATSYGWRWAFGVNLPLGALILAGTAVLVPETRDPAVRRVGDPPGTVLSAGGLAALVFALIEGQRYGWWSATRPFSAGPFRWPDFGLSPIPVALAAGVVMLVALVVVERARAAAGRPVVLDLSLFRIPDFRRGNAAASLISVGELGLMFVLPLFLQDVHGNSPLQVSVAILPLAVGTFLAGGMSARLSRRLGAARMLQAGMALEVIAAALIGLTTRADTTGFGLAPWMLVYGIGLGLTTGQLTRIVLRDVPPASTGLASGTQSTARQVGSALGIALIGAVFAVGLSHAMTTRLHEAGLPARQGAVYADRLRDSAGTFAHDLRRKDPGLSRAADESLAAATDRAAFATAALLAVGLLLTLRLRSGTGREESSA
ncbi:MFS transporter [Actinoallomurus rhizosphaericola]|uniref:MFS transporter n=1 Tax=Actinoallomurus rhizosphaericola TaxID=2952536 RepID=UPI00209095BA|nr:MFS transporter [Actinoallomurus rhizosphaericola]MCO5992338.1 MFS transporter [Actinoallomurus rhizosphaericola]